MLRLLANRAPNRSFNEILKLARLRMNLAKHETLESRFGPVYLDSTRHACCQLIAIPQKLLTEEDKVSSIYVEVVQG